MPDFSEENAILLHVVGQLDYGGVEARMELLGEGQHRSRFSHQFCALGKGGHVSSRLQSGGAKVWEFCGKERIPSLLSAVRLARLVFSIRPAIIHCHGVEANFHGGIVALLFGLPFVCEEIGMPSHSHVARRVLRFLYARSGVVIAVAEETKNAIVQLEEVEENHVLVLESPARPGISAKGPQRTNESLTLAFVGRLEHVKNPLALVEALSLLKSGGVIAKLLIVGDGSLRKELEARVSALGLDSCVVMTGFHPSPMTLIQGSTLFIQPSLSEGSSMALVEAMLLEIPPVVTGLGGGAGIVTEGETGWVLDDVSPASIADKLMGVATLPMSELRAVGRRARGAVEGRFDRDAYVLNLDEIYTRVLSGRGVA